MENVMDGPLFRRRMGRVLVIATWIAVAENVAVSSSHFSRPHLLVTWLGAILFLVAFPLSFERPGPALLLVSGAGAVIMAFALPSNTSFAAAVATIALAGTRLSPPAGWAVSAITALGFLARLTTSTHSLTGGVVSSAAGLLFTYIAADALRRLREEQRRTQELLQEVIAGRDASIRAAALDERSRLAREMHDILAHTLSALTIQLESARLLVEQRPDDPATLAAVERAGKLAREGLEEARRAVGSLRGDTLPGPDLLGKLAADFEQDTGIPVRLEIEGTARDLPPDGRLALYRVAQEALTNVRKHADATSVDMKVRYGDGAAELTVENEGQERPSPVAGGGFGLSGMRERAELVGGRLEAGPTEHGFRVHLWIPT